MTHTFTNTNPATLDEATKLSDIDAVFENTLYLKDEVDALNAATVDLTTDVTGVLPFANGGRGVLNSQYTTVGNVGGGVDNLLTYSLPGGTLGTNGQAIRITGWGKASNTATTKNVYLNFGSDLLASLLIAASDGTQHWRFEALVVRTGATTQRSTTLGSVIPARTSVGEVATNALTQTLSGAITISLQGLGTVDNDVTAEGMIVEAVY